MFVIVSFGLSLAPIRPRLLLRPPLGLPRLCLRACRNRDNYNSHDVYSLHLHPHTHTMSSITGGRVNVTFRWVSAAFRSSSGPPCFARGAAFASSLHSEKGGRGKRKQFRQFIESGERREREREREREMVAILAQAILAQAASAQAPSPEERGASTRATERESRAILAKGGFAELRAFSANALTGEIGEDGAQGDR